MQALQRFVQMGVDDSAEGGLAPVGDDMGALSGEIADQALAGVVDQLHAFSP